MGNSEWKNYKLKDVMTLKYGKNQKKVVCNTGQYPIYGTGGLMGYADNYLYDKPSVLIPRKGSINNKYYFDEPFWTVDTLFYSIINEEIVIPKFLYYKFLTINLNNYNEGTTIPSLRTQTLNEIKLNIPTLTVQKQIRDILATIDLKIELNNKINENLEETAKALYHEWFVNFNFPNEDGLPYKDNGGEFVESDLGEIPIEWEVSSIKEISKNVITGKTPSTKNKENYGDKIPFITIPDLKDNIWVVSTQRSLSKIGELSQKNKTLPKGSICVSCIATPGLVSFTSKESQTNQQINSIICQDDIGKYYVFHNLKSKEQEIITLGSGGTTTYNLNKRNFENIKLVIPSKDIMFRFNEICENLFYDILSRSNANMRLNNIKNLLLNKLMSGQIDTVELDLDWDKISKTFEEIEL